MTHYRWFVVAITFFAIIINYLDRTALSYAIAPIETTFGLNNTDFGLIAAGFGFGYLIMTVIGGIIVDKWGAHKIWAIFAILWSIACAMLGFATGFWWFFIFRVLLGIAEGPNFPALSRVNADWLPVSERARALAIGLAAVPFASVLGAPLISNLIISVGWRWMFIILGSLGIVWALIWAFIFRDHPKQSKHVSAEELSYIQSDRESLQHQAHNLKEQKTTWKFILFNRALLVNNYAFFAFGYLLFFAITWLPGYLEQTYAIKVKTVGWFLILPWLLATVLILLGGFLSDWLWNKTHNIRVARSHIIWVCQVLSAICFLPLLFSHDLWIAILSITLGVGFGMMPNAAFYAINADLARDRVATSLGVMDCAFAAAGICAPFLTGMLSNLTGNFTGAFTLLISLTISSALAVIFFQHPGD